jgi:replication factor C small subunit
MALFDSLWIEKYRPKTLDEIVLPERTKQEFLKYKEAKEIPHICLVSAPGQGKTSLAKIIVTEILDCVYLYINASDENGIDTVRTKITDFVRTKSIDGKIKVVILDEADGLTQQGQSALRNLMEEYSSNVRFIITGNRLYQITAAIQSRCQEHDITPPLELTIKRIRDILVAEKIQVDPDQKEKIISLVRSCHPDLRRIIGTLQKNVINGKLDIQTTKMGLDFAQTVYDKVRGQVDVTSIRRYIIENEMKYGKDYHGLLRDIFNVVDNDPALSSDKKRKYMVTLAEHMYRHTSVMDPEINCYAAIINLMDI